MKYEGQVSIALCTAAMERNGTVSQPQGLTVSGVRSFRAVLAYLYELQEPRARINKQEKVMIQMKNKVKYLGVDCAKSTFDSNLEDSSMTQLRQLEIVEQLCASEQPFSSAFAVAVIGMAIISPDGRFLKVNRAFSNILGYTDEDLKNRRFAELTDAGDLGIRSSLQSLSAGEIESFETETGHSHRQGHSVFLRASVSATPSETGRPDYLIAQYLRGSCERSQP